MDNSTTVISCVFAVFLGLIPASIAKNKGHDFLAWWVFGAALFIVALPMAILLKPNTKKIEQIQMQTGEMKKCPYCAEIIKIDAKVCRYCGRELVKPKRRVAKINPPIELSQLENSPQIRYCPQCGIPVKIAKAISGDFQGQDFYVCPNYQQCNQYWHVTEP